MANISRTAPGSCSFPAVKKICNDLLQKTNRKWHPKITHFSPLSNVSDCCANHMWELMLKLQISVTRYGGLRLPFCGITEYLHGLVSMYEHPIVATVQVLIFILHMKKIYTLEALGIGDSETSENKRAIKCKFVTAKFNFEAPSAINCQTVQTETCCQPLTNFECSK